MIWSCERTSSGRECLDFPQPFMLCRTLGNLVCDWGEPCKSQTGVYKVLELRASSVESYFNLLVCMYCDSISNYRITCSLPQESCPFQHVGWICSGVKSLLCSEVSLEELYLLQHKSVAVPFCVWNPSPGISDLWRFCARIGVFLTCVCVQLLSVSVLGSVSEPEEGPL